MSPRSFVARSWKIQTQVSKSTGQRSGVIGTSYRICRKGAHLHRKYIVQVHKHCDVRVPGVSQRNLSCDVVGPPAIYPEQNCFPNHSAQEVEMINFSCSDYCSKQRSATGLTGLA